MRYILLMLLGVACSSTTSPAQLTLDKAFPPAMEMSGDWYRIEYPGTMPRLRTNHTLASLRVAFTGTRTIGLDWATDFFMFNTIVPGAFSWRLKKWGYALPWNHGAIIGPDLVLANNLDPWASYELEVYTTIIPLPAPGTLVSQIERWRDQVALQGYFFELRRVIADDSAIFSAPAASLPVMNCVIYGDSLADGLVPGVGGPNPRGAFASWPRKALEYACANIQTPRTPRFINHSAGGWWGCGIEFPYLGFPDEPSWRAANPWAAPNFWEVVEKSHLGAPRFEIQNVELVIYQLAQNDIATGRLSNAPAYEQDIIDNVNLIRQTWPGAKILVCSTHLDTSNGLLQRQLMFNALDTLGYRFDPDLHFVDTGQVLASVGITNQPGHPIEPVHDIWGMLIGMHLVTLIDG